MLSLIQSTLALFFLVCFQSGTCCPDNWVTFQGSCFYFHHAEQSFTEAQIDSEDENQFLKDFISYQTPEKYWWVGLSDEDIEGIWKWAGSGDRLTYRNWYSGEPNNHNNEDCVLTEPSRNFMWTDARCSLLCYSICELRDATGGEVIVG